MERPDKNQALVLSVLDRLLDDEPGRAVDPERSRAHTLADLRDTVRRDLENLLNTRQRCRGWSRDMVELETSLLSYGVPDITSANLSTEAQRQAYARTVEQIIRRFEPRFQTVGVALLANADEFDRTMRFRIEALIYADPAPEPMVFDSTLDPSSRSFTVMSRAYG